MSEKTGWLGGILGKHSAKPLPTSAKRCAQGHPMAMDWQKCPYCEAANSAAERTRFTQHEPDATGAARLSTGPTPARPGPTRVNEPTSAGPTMGGRRQTLLDDEEAPRPPPPMASGAPRAASGGGSGRRHTSVMDADDLKAPQEQRRPGGGRALTGILYTFSWSKLGQLFEIRDGRNYVGSGTVAADGDRPVDVLVSEDDKLSGAHFLVLCQGEKYRIRDCDSTNGTFVNGEQIDALGIDLQDGSLVQAGATLFAFQKVRPPSTASAGLEPEADEAEPEPKPEYFKEEHPGRDRSI